MTPFVELRNLTKVFPGIIANDSVNCDFLHGEIHALLGENGAGKSTLMNILYGLYQPDEGEIFINGKRTDINSPLDAISQGIGMVHQHFMLIPTFTVAENIILGNEPIERGQLPLKKINQQVQALAEKYQMCIAPEAKVQDISIGMAQKVEILKALYRGADLLILDEPTAVLTPQEIVELGGIMRSLTATGKTIIFITHKLKEVISYSDRITVIRRGKVIATLPTVETNQECLAEMMVGRHVSFRVEKEKSKPAKTVLQMKDVYCKNDRKLPALRGLNLQVRAGEIVGIAGIEGNGQSELIDLLTGLRGKDSGEIWVDGERVDKLSAREMMERSVSCIPEDRQKFGLVLAQSVEENLIIKELENRRFSSGSGRIKWKDVRKWSGEQIDRYDIRTPSPDTKAGTLSGGNQQKVVIAREIGIKPRLLIAAQPTRGLDIGAIEFVHKTMVNVRNEGIAVLLVSFELDEILSISDRILIIYEGRIVGEFEPGKVTEEQIGILMAGGSRTPLQYGLQNGDHHGI